jgi:hypothetical protein
MLNIWSVLANDLWIMGMALMLAVLSREHWVASVKKKQFCELLKQPQIQQTLDLGLIFFCAGLALTSRPWWKQAIWSLLAAAWGIQAWFTQRTSPS